MSTLRISSVIYALTLCWAMAGTADASIPGNLQGASVRQVTEVPRSYTALAKTHEDGWLAWAVPTATQRSICCQEGKRCELGEEHGFTMQREPNLGSKEVQVYLRLKAGHVAEMRYFSSDCSVDAAGSSVIWLGSITQRTSLQWLQEIGERQSDREVRERVLAGISLHEDQEADEILLRVARGQLAWQLEEEAIFWFGAERGERGFDILQQLEDEMPGKLRRQVAFAFHLSSAEGATAALIRMARRDPVAEVRSQALFWLGQEAGEKVVSVLEQAVDDDPEVEVREHAVFALSQMSEGRGIPHLLRFAREHRMPQVRQKALFWLGQSKDPRALALFEEILLD